jgi:ABC-type polysaccharide/polyol phosphate export permease
VALLLAYHFVFASVFRVGAVTGTSFLSFVAVGLWPWLAMQEAIVRGTASVQNHAALVKKVAFPVELVVVASAIATFAVQLVGFTVALLVLKIVGEPIGLAGLGLAVFLWIILFFAALGLGLALAAVQVFARDVEHALGPILMVLMYLAPVLYPLSAVPGSLRPLVASNPFSYLVQRFRDALLGGSAMPVLGDLVALAGATLVLLLGYAFFRRLSPFFEDFL